MACPGCSSPNTEKLSHYWESLPGESPLKVRYAPPAVVQARVLMVLGVVAAGIWIAVTGAVLWGLGVAVAGLVWGVVMLAAVAASQSAHGEWAASQLCLSCTNRWQP
ncbi:hypothetical protein [Streptomyces kaempferi]|uniref:Uncharacterized protein n=1 Tax=Streptomyces kaempferi TaxID=333725 RepID=A0ABW3XIL2_9ACTN